MTWTSEDVKLVEKFIEIRNRGYYVSGEELTSAYNRILHKNANVTNCGSCLRQRTNELETALLRFKKQLEVNNTSEEKEELTEPLNEPKKTRGKKKTE